MKMLTSFVLAASLSVGGCSGMWDPWTGDSHRENPETKISTPTIPKANVPAEDEELINKLKREVKDVNDVREELARRGYSTLIHGDGTVSAHKHVFLVPTEE